MNRETAYFAALLPYREARDQAHARAYADFAAKVKADETEHGRGSDAAWRAETVASDTKRAAYDAADAIYSRECSDLWRRMTSKSYLDADSALVRPRT
jgi:hypothetical protein